MATYNHPDRPAPRTPNRPSGSRPQQRVNGSRPQQRPNAAAQHRRKKRRVQKRFYAFIAVLVVLIIAIVLIITKPFGKKTPATASPTPTPAPTAQADATDSTDSADRASTLAQMLGDQDSNIQGLTADQLTQVDDLSINQSLPSDWMNILLLGSDERSLTESARTDSMIICSINMQTGQVKLTSIMRDLAVYFGNLGSNSATYRINAANYFGGERLAMKTVNECFGMNIDKYVRVNFYGFQQIAQIQQIDR